MSVSALLSKFSDYSILVVGDVMLDEYLWCSAHRISPEAPVPICRVEKTSYRPGGAANVAANIQSLGGTCRLLGQLGKDPAAQSFKEMMTDLGISMDHMVTCEIQPTIQKSRIIAHSQHVVRLDKESIDEPLVEVGDQLLDHARPLLKEVQLLVISDYGKGTLSKPLIQSLIQEANAVSVPVIVDPKGTDFSKYQGATLITPNFSEFSVLTNDDLDSEDAILEH